MASPSVTAEAAAVANLLEFYDPLLHLGTRSLDVTRHQKALRGAGPWSSPVQLEALTQLRAAVGYWLGSSSKAVVAQDDLDRLASLTSMMLSFSEQVVQLPRFEADWTSPLSVMQGAQGGLVGMLVGAATTAGRSAATGVAAAASSAVSGAPPAEVLRRGLQAALQGQPQPPPGGELAGLSSAAQRTFWQANTLQQEAALWVFAYAAAARQAGLQRYLGYAHSSAMAPVTSSAGAGSDPVADSAAAVQLLRQAAGLFEFLESKVIPLVEVADPSGNRRVQVPELQRPVISCLAMTCLAEAQAITTARAKDKGSSPLLIAGLEAGTSQLYLMARMALGGATLPPISPTMATLNPVYTPPQTAHYVVNAVRRLNAYATVAQAMHLCRSRLSQSADFEAKGEMGFAQAIAAEAETITRAALRNAKQAGYAEPAWLSSLEAQLNTAVYAVARTEKDRLQITYQPLPKDPVDAPAAKVLVATIPTAPTPYVPPELPASEVTGGNCTIQ